MKRPRITSFRTRSILVAASALAAGSLVWALHPKSAGPEQFEIKFKLPPPKPLTPAEELKTFKVPKGFHVELVAAEPMIEVPVAQSWDEQGTFSSAKCAATCTTWRARARTSRSAAS